MATAKDASTAEGASRYSLKDPAAIRVTASADSIPDSAIFLTLRILSVFVAPLAVHNVVGIVSLRLLGHFVGISESNE